MRSLIQSIVYCLTLSSAASGADLPGFTMKEIDPLAGQVCYAVTLADVDGDQRQDIVVVTENRVLWYRNPDWKLHVVIADQTPRDNVCIAVQDIDRDGQVDFALGAGWTKTGTIHWLSRGASLDEKWQVHSIGEELSLHRMRFADVLGTGREQLVISPLNATGDNAGARLMAFEVPSDPKKDRWPATVLDASLNRMHAHWHIDLDDNGAVDTLAVGREGVFLVRRQPGGWSKTKLGTGASSPMKDLNGAGEIKPGRLRNGRRFIATVEPMHGESLAVYTAPAEKDGLWNRHVAETTLKRGHALWTADLDRDGSDEIVLGHSDPGTGPVKGPGVFIYRAEDADGSKWSRHTVDDGGIATEDLVVADLTGDGWPDIVAVGRATHNVRLYVNSGQAR